MVAALVSDTGPWVIEAPLGRGGQGTTFRAHHAETGRVVALKRFRLAEADGWKAHDLFVRECETLRALEHPSIPRFVDSGESGDGTLWLAMDMAPGEPLSDAVKAGRPLDQATLEDLALQILAVLEYLHSRLPPVVHRDLKPANLVVGPDGWVALVDFGSVRTALRPDGGSTMVGTFGYLAPEQLHGEATAATDLYSLGMTLAALATGIDAASLPRKGLRLDLERLVPDGRLRELILALTAPDPADRPQSAQAARTLMAKARVPASLTRPATVPAQPAPTPAPPMPADAYAGAPMEYDPRWRHGRPPKIMLFLIRLALAIGGRFLGLVERVILPGIQRARLRRAERKARRNPYRLARDVELLRARETYEQAQLERARQSLGYLRERYRKGSDAPARQRLPRRER
ncbi:MAG: serine/threonine-protein kinase [Myxococcota bacterium]